MTPQQFDSPFVRPPALTTVVAAAAEVAQTGRGSRAEHETWSVTAWSEHFEVFPEVEPLVAGQAADAHARDRACRFLAAP